MLILKTNMAFPSPIFIYGDLYVAQNTITSAKKKYPELKWVVKSASTESLESIRMEAGLFSWDDSEKVLLIKEIPDKKAVREFLIDLSSSCADSTKLIIWDSENHVKLDPKTRIMEKTWEEFIETFRGIKGAKIINSGDLLTEKQMDECIDFVIKCFEKHGKEISSYEARILINIVGYDRGLLDSDISKMCITCPNKIDAQFILDNAFPTSKEAVLYKLSNVLDTGTYEDAINMTEQFLNNGINGNVIAEIFAKKARWQMVVAHLWAMGMPWGSISGKLMGMGRFPSAIWYNEEINENEKRSIAEQYQSPDGIIDFLTSKQGIPRRYLKIIEDKKAKIKTTMTRKGAEIIPMPFMADQYVNTVRNHIVAPNSDVPEQELKKKVLNRAIRVYLFVQEKLANIRYGKNPSQQIQEIIEALKSYKLDSV